ncbi:MAG: replicative DNA helicase [Pelagibaca sp.]
MAEILHFNPVGNQGPTTFCVEAEQTVLGSILIDNSHVSIVAERGGSDLFHDPAHREIWRRCSELERDGILASPVSLREWFDAQPWSKDLGGPAYLARMAGISNSQVSYYADYLRELHNKRQIMHAIDQARTDALQGEVPAAHISEKLIAALSAVEGGRAAKLVSMMSATHIAADQAFRAHRGEVADFVPTGIRALDDIVGGLYPGELILLGGRPSMGKTSVALNIGLNAARAGHGVAFCSFEMTPEALALRAVSERMASQGSAVSYRDLRAGQWDERLNGTFADACEDVAQLPMYMLPREYADIGALMAGAKRAKAMLKGNLKLLIVDYVQLMRAHGKSSRYELITEISTALKQLAGQLNIPVVALSQLSRAVEQRDDKRPILSDLRESGQLEQDADAVLFTYRDEYYLEREKPEDPAEYDIWLNMLERSRNRLEIICAKQRQGPIGTANVLCNVAFNRIWEPDR